VHISMPKAEEIATALLQLTNNPALFDKWAVQNGLAFKADGQVFTVRSDRLTMRKPTKCTPAQCATKYLKRIAALTGAKQVCGESYRLTTGRMHFLVDSKFVRVMFSPLRINVLFCCGGSRHAERGSGGVCIAATEEQRKTV